MNNLIIIGVIITVSLLIGIPLSIAKRNRLQKYWSRSCAGGQWRHCFPDAPKDDIRRFLEAFVNAFGFKSKHRLQFNPTDKMMDVYRTVYPIGSAIDAMEFESFALALEREYGVDLTRSEDIEKLTLGNVFQMTRNPNKSLLTYFK